MGIIVTFFTHRWYVFLMGLLYWLAMKYLAKNTRHAREISQVSATLQILFLLIYTGSTLWLLSAGEATSKAYTLFTLVTSIGGALVVTTLFIMLLYRGATAKFLARFPEWGKNIYRFAIFGALGFISYPTIAIITTLYYGW